MRRPRPLLSFLLGAALLLPLAACQPSTTTTVGGTNDATVSQSQATGDETTPASDGTAHSDHVFDVDTTQKGFTPFEQPVKVTIGMSVDPTNKTLPVGDSADSNQYTRYLEKNFNIQIEASWTAASGNDFNQRVSLAISSNTMPDAMVVPDRTYMTKAAKSGMLYDITDLFQEMQSDQVQSIVASTNGMAMENASYEGRMVSLPNITTGADGVHTLMIRKDWLDKAGLGIPKTLEDVQAAARAFIDQKLGGEQTLGIMGPTKSSKLYCTFLTSSNNAYGFDPVFQAFDVYPGYWLKGDDGKVQYGTLDPKMKDALTLLQNWYKDGLIDPEMGTRDSSGEIVSAGQSGIFFGPWWAIGYGNGDSFRNDPDADWQSYPIYDAEGKWNVHQKTVGTSYTLINKNASEDTARAVILMNNALVRDETKFDRTTTIDWWPLRNVMAAMDETEHEYRELMKILKGEATAEDYADEVVYKMMAQDASLLRKVIPTADGSQDLGVKDFDMTDFGDFQRMYSLMVGGRPSAALKPDKDVYSVTYNQTDGMEQKWPNLQRLEEETMMKIIVGAAEVSEFDTFVDKWLKQGGQDIIAEVQALADAN